MGTHLQNAPAAQPNWRRGCAPHLADERVHRYHMNTCDAKCLWEVRVVTHTRGQMHDPKTPNVRPFFDERSFLVGLEPKEATRRKKFFETCQKRFDARLVGLSQSEVATALYQRERIRKYNLFRSLGVHAWRRDQRAKHEAELQFRLSAPLCDLF